MTRYAALLWVGLLVLPGGLRAEERVDYVRAVKPILAKRCYACHGALQQKAKLRLDTGGSIKRGGEGGPAVVAGASDESLLVDAVTGDESWRMPPEGERLSAEEVATLKAWVDQGAESPADEAPQLDPRKHWAFVPPARPAVPQVQDGGWSRNPVDAFLAAEHAKRRLKPRPEADRSTLLRRVTLDLIGLAPTPEERRRFLNDPSPDAYERVVEWLLADSRFGERWGRHWMDVWRYSDWDGFGAEVRESQPHIWRWRDWIVESLNGDRAYDEMLVAMLAADESVPGDERELRATGFLVRNWYKFNRNVWLDATVEHTGKAFLGITLNCARCHDHKYDPIAQADYYRVRAFFEPHEVRTDRLPGQPDVAKDGLVHAFDAKADAPTFLLERGDEKHPVTDRPLAPGLPAVLHRGSLAVQGVSLPPPVYYPGLRPFVQEESLAQARADIDAKLAALTQAKQQVADSRQRLDAIVAGGDAKPMPSAKAEPFLADDFASPNPERWQVSAGEWRYEKGKLLQSKVGDEECRLLSHAEHPRDFSAEFRFKIQGGNQWQSVGLSFDFADAGNALGVYLSHFAGGPKVQVFERRNGQSQYPATGTKPYAVQLDREHTLRVDVRGQLVNVAVDGQVVLAYRLSVPRQAGRFAVWTFDASAEFVNVRVDSLAGDARLVEPPAGSGAPVTNEAGARAALAKAEAGVPVAEKAVEVSRANAAAVSAKVAADRAKFAEPPSPDAERLAKEASLADRRLAALQAEEKLLRAEVALSEAKQAGKDVAAAQKGLDEARKAAETARVAQAKESTDYSPLGPVYPASSTGRRLALARWLARRENPLTARVAVNHVWARHFGEPLVPTVFDFGLNGRPPTHPALLDWLAVELMDRGWSLKALHRQIVTSPAYRMDSAGDRRDDPNHAVDPANAYLWRMNPRRMEAETVRDNVLHVAGNLDPALGGADLDPDSGLSSRRRSLYFRHAKEKRMTFLRLFDSANVNSCYRRTESVMPQQALALANSPLALDQSRLLAAKLSGDDATFVIAAFERVLGREPTSDEQAACTQYLSEQASRLVDKAHLSAFASGPPGAVKPSGDPRQRARENLVHVLMNHNDFLTIR
ncbi:MAG: PSD1 and planctomycete cytochrome C domain-containing protein [Isosphaeraceae bacterium]|nr:PSD1 and planctomycete cytochrome C domain-containing protein [Isosphaeraceae bacterium]